MKLYVAIMYNLAENNAAQLSMIITAHFGFITAYVAIISYTI